jgi:FkbM family methyltransferase
MLSTKHKIFIARSLNWPIAKLRALSGRGTQVDVTRGGIRWRLDLQEGIDFAIYLGVYQRIAAATMAAWVRPGSVALDIGANIGSHALPLARQVGATGRLVAIEPTDFAFAKLVANAALNADLSAQTILIQAALTDRSNTPAAPAFYARWPIGQPTKDLHESHLGQLESARGARFVALDALLDELRGAHRIDKPVAFAKLDVDGHELAVLRGATRLLESERPALLIEMAPAVQDEVPGRFEQLIGLIADAGYELTLPGSGKRLPLSADALREFVGHGASVDLLAQPLPR